MIPKKQFGRTGHESSRTIFGSAALSSVTQDEADQMLELLLSYGVNHIDTAAGYGDSELHIGPWMKNHRHNFFLATKTEKRIYREARDELYRSLDRLKVDSVDLWQMHVLVNPHEWEIAMGPGGVLDAFVEAREKGLTRFLGVTGHGLTAAAMHLKSLDRFDFDSVLLPYNYIQMQNTQYAADFKKLAKVCSERNVALQTIKSLARGPLEDKQGKHAVWYDPLEDDKAIAHAVHWVLGNKQVFLNTVGDIHLLPKVLAAADQYHTRPSDASMQDDVLEMGITPLFMD